MKKSLFALLFMGTALLYACGGGDNGDGADGGEKADPNVLAEEYCNCLDMEDTGPCLEMSIEHAKALASDKDAFEMYTKMTEECSMKMLEEAAEAAAEAIGEAVDAVEEGMEEVMDAAEGAVEEMTEGE